MTSVKRRQEERSASTTGALRRATVTLIAEKGYANATTTEIAARAEVSRGALLHHYPQKIDLIVDAAEHVWADAARHLRRLSEALAADPSDVDGFVDGLWKSVFHETAVKMSLDLLSAAQADHALRARIEPPLRSLFVSYDEIALETLAASSLSARDRRTLVSHITCTLRGLRVQELMTNSPEMTGAVMNALKAYARDMLRNEGAS